MYEAIEQAEGIDESGLPQAAYVVPEGNDLGDASTLDAGSPAGAPTATAAAASK